MMQNAKMNLYGIERKPKSFVIRDITQQEVGHSQDNINKSMCKVTWWGTREHANRVREVRFGESI